MKKVPKVGQKVLDWLSMEPVGKVKAILRERGEAKACEIEYEAGPVVEYSLDELEVEEEKVYLLPSPLVVAKRAIRLLDSVELLDPVLVKRALSVADSARRSLGNLRMKIVDSINAQRSMVIEILADKLLGALDEKVYMRKLKKLSEARRILEKQLRYIDSILSELDAKVTKLKLEEEK